METIRKNKERFRILIDSSYILRHIICTDSNDLPLKKRFNFDEFAKRTKHLIKFRHRGAILRFINMQETSYLVEPFAYDWRVRKGIIGLRHLDRDDSHLKLVKNPIYKYFYSHAGQVGNELGQRKKRAPLSEVDTEFCAYALTQLTSRDLIVATQDKTIMDTIAYLYSWSREKFKENGCPDTDLYFAGNCHELDKYYNYCRFGLFHSSTTKNGYFNWNEYGRYARKLWLDRDDLCLIIPGEDDLSGLRITDPKTGREI